MVSYDLREDKLLRTNIFCTSMTTPENVMGKIEFSLKWVMYKKVYYKGQFIESSIIRSLAIDSYDQ